MIVNTQTQLCALIGDPVSHSLSPAIHNAAFEALGLNYIYLAFRVINCQGAIEGIRAFEQLKGFSVTIPHKINVCKYLDWIDDVAVKIGSVNTIIKDQDCLKGYNTDGTGAIKAFREAGVNVGDKNILMLGSGGVARSIAFSLLTEEVPPSALTILGIDEAQYRGLASDLISLERSDVSVRENTEESLEEGIKKAHILINCTPIGMWPQTTKSPVPSGLLHKDLTVFDVVYNPLKTQLIKDAEKKGSKSISGLSMFIYQAMEQFELWTNQNAPFDIMRGKALEYLE